VAGRDAEAIVGSGVEWIVPRRMRGGAGRAGGRPSAAVLEAYAPSWAHTRLATVIMPSAGSRPGDSHPAVADR
jgi:hypothetical protein